MPRQARKISSTGIYHIMARGINRQRIFNDDEDSLNFLKAISKSKEKSEFALYGYCIMGNHVHLLISEGKEPLSLSMQRISSGFVYWYNGKYDRVGHLFQERFRSEVVESEGYLITVLRYIHQNPVKAGIVGSPEKYLWSSYRGYVGNKEIIDTEPILKLFGSEKVGARKKFMEIMNQKNEDVCLEYEERHRYSDEEVMQFIEEHYGVKGGFIHHLESEKTDSILKDLKATKGVTIRQLARLTGVSKYRVERA